MAYILNRQTGKRASGDFAQKVTGPDGVQGSAIEFDGLDHIEIELHRDLDEDFTIQFGHKK